MIFSFALGFSFLGLYVLIKLCLNRNKYINWVGDIKESSCHRRKYGKIAKMDLKTLLMIYKVNPKRFRYEDGLNYRGYSDNEVLHILYNGHQESSKRKVVNYLSNTINTITIIIAAEDRWTDEDGIASIILPFADYYRFLKMVKKYKRDQQKSATKKAIHEAKQKEVVDTQFVFESAQADIAKLMKESEKQLQQGRETLFNTMKKIVQER